MPIDYLVQQSFLAGAKETTWGTPVVTPTFWIPIMDAKWSPKVKWLPDTSMVGSPAVTRDLVPGKRYDELTFKSNMYLDSIGNQLLNILGAQTVTGTGPYTHTFKLLNNGAIGSQANSYTLQFYDSVQARELAGAMLQSLEFSWSADGGVEINNTWLSTAESDVTTPTNTPTTTNFVPGWNLGVSLGGSASNLMISGSLKIDRATAPIFVSDATQAPHLVFATAIKVTGKVKFLVETGGFNPFSGSNNAVSRNQLATVLTFTDPVTSNSLAFTMSKCQFINPSTDSGSKWYQVDAEFEGVSNTTDASTGISPIQATLINSVPTY